MTEEDLGLTAAHYLYLSGTPFRAITNGEFTEDATFDWTYVDEQEAKEGWREAGWTESLPRAAPDGDVRVRDRPRARSATPKTASSPASR